MTITIHHLNCGTLEMPSAPMACHVLLLEHGGDLLLIDTGIGLQDIADPEGRFGPARFVVRPAFDPKETAIERIRALGLDPDRVTDILLTHADVDHVGGLADFPRARVHLGATEARAAFRGDPPQAKPRYNPAGFAHAPLIVEHEEQDGVWRGSIRATPLDVFCPGLLMLSLPGHTPGHVGYAIPTEHGGWLIHAGDAFYHRGSVDGTDDVPAAIRALEQAAAFDLAEYQRTQAMLGQVVAEARGDVEILCSHDASMFPPDGRGVLA